MTFLSSSKLTLSSIVSSFSATCKKDMLQAMKVCRKVEEICDFFPRVALVVVLLLEELHLCGCIRAVGGVVAGLSWSGAGITRRKRN